MKRRDMMRRLAPAAASVWTAGAAFAQCETQKILAPDAKDHSYFGMPSLDGHETARRIRQEPWGKEMVLVALTGWGQTEDRRRSLEAGFNHHLVKPADPIVVAKLISSLA